MCSLLLSISADPNIPELNGCTPLFGASQSNSVTCAKLLIYAGANVELAKVDGATLLFVAAQEGCTECVKVNILTGRQHSPLYVAALMGNLTIIKYLVEEGSAGPEMECWR